MADNVDVNSDVNSVKRMACIKVFGPNLGFNVQPYNQGRSVASVNSEPSCVLAQRLLEELLTAEEEEEPLETTTDEGSSKNLS